MPSISIVVPVYHNAPSLSELHGRFTDLANRNPDDTFEFVFVDDGSRDDSFAVLTDLAAQDARVRAVKLSRNFGSNAAVLAGLSRATGDAVAAISADLQDPPELIHDMLAAWRGGRKVVLAARDTRGDPWLTAFAASCFYRVFRRFALPSMPKGGFDFFLLDRQVVEHIDKIREANVYLTGLILWLGFDPAIIPYHRRPREARFGRSMWTLAKKVKYALDSFVAFSYFPIRAVSYTGIALSLIGFAYAAVVVVASLTRGAEVPGWSSLMMVLLIVSGVQMTMLGLLGEYLFRTLDETRRRPRFVIDRTVGGDEPDDSTVKK